MNFLTAVHNATTWGAVNIPIQKNGRLWGSNWYHRIAVGQRYLSDQTASQQLQYMLQADTERQTYRQTQQSTINATISTIS